MVDSLELFVRIVPFSDLTIENIYECRDLNCVKVLSQDKEEHNWEWYVNCHIIKKWSFTSGDLCTIDQRFAGNDGNRSLLRETKNSRYMKVIVTSWMFPSENGGNDDRPKSIERISSSIEDLKRFLKDYYPEKDKFVFKKTLLHLQVMGTPDEKLFSDSDDITRYYNGDGFKYLEECLKDDSLGQCVAKIYREGWEQHATYYLFQVRNLH